MNSKEFKIVFDQEAKKIGFQKAFGGWFREFSDTIAVLELQKSKYGDYYQLLGKVYMRGAFGRDYTISKDLISRMMWHVGFDEPKEYRDVFDFDKEMEDSLRIEKLQNLFERIITPFLKKVETLEDIKTLVE